MSDRTFTPRETICPFCGVGCGLTYDASREKATGWHGAVNRRGELCPKGVAAFDVVDHPERLTRPLVRESDDLVEVTWEEAFARIEAAVAETLADVGPEGLFWFASSKCTNEENYVLQKTARLLGTNSVDNCARLCHASTVAAMAERFGAGAMTNTLDDVVEAEVFFVVGANPAENHPIIFSSYLLPAIKQGTKMVHVDPRANATTKAADYHLPVRPGTDVLLLNALSKVVLDEGLTDEGFLAERVTGREVFESHLAALDVDEAAREAGVDADDLRAVARLVGEADGCAFFTGMGMSQHTHGTDNVHALLDLALLTGNVGRRGAGVNPLRGQNNVQGASDVGALPDLFPGYAPVSDPAARARFAEVWGVEPPEEPGLTETEAVHRFGDDVRVAVCFGENPAVTEPNVQDAAAKLAALDCLVCIDVFPTETVELADVVLPASIWAEKSGTVTNTDRQVQRMREMADPPGDARRDFDVLCELGRRLLSLPEAPTGADPSVVDFSDPEAAFEELRRVAPSYAGISYDGIGTGSQRWPKPSEAEAGTGVLHVERFANGSTTVPLAGVEYIDHAELAADELTLTTGRVLQHYNSGALTRRSGILTRLRSADALQIHPDDAATRDIEDGDEVAVSNDRGSVTLAAEVTPAVRQGVVFCTFHFADPLVNTLVADDLDPTAKIPGYKRTPVRVRVEA
jgi:formate dehydrogenase alpha subunit